MPIWNRVRRRKFSEKLNVSSYEARYRCHSLQQSNSFRNAKNVTTDLLSAMKPNLPITVSHDAIG